MMHNRTYADRHWTTTNASEAIPGVLTPLGWTLWGPCGEKAMRRVFHAIGGLPASELAIPADERDLLISVFHGRIAINVESFVRIGNAMPGANGADLAQQMLGFVPPELPTGTAWRRYPVVLAKFPPVFLRMPARARSLCVETERWYRSVIAEAGQLDLAGAQALFREAQARFEDAVFVQTLITTSGIQPVFQQVTALARRAGIDPSALMVGHGSHAESQVVQDLWDCSRGRVPLAEVVARHGFHGPGEGHVHGTVWRQDARPLERVLETYRGMRDERDPVRESALRTGERLEAEAQLLASLGRRERPVARMVLRLAERYLPLRGGCKAAFLQSLDVCRATAARIGDVLVAAGHLADADDVYYLTCDELLTTSLPQNMASAVAIRRAQRERYLDIDLPVAWRGDPVPMVRAEPAQRLTRLTGAGVSGGQTTGRARVVLDPLDIEMEIGDVLVAHTTDPSWAPVMYPAAALVVEIGGQLSHAAVVARELGIPCVMGVPAAMTAIRDGEVVRVDGSAGTVEILGACVTT